MVVLGSSSSLHPLRSVSVDGILSFGGGLQRLHDCPTSGRLCSFESEFGMGDLGCCGQLLQHRNERKAGFFEERKPYGCWWTRLGHGYPCICSPSRRLCCHCEK